MEEYFYSTSRASSVFIGYAYTKTNKFLFAKMFRG